MVNVVSTHGSLAGADVVSRSAHPTMVMFQLTAPLREPTYNESNTHSLNYVSTHGSLAGADDAAYKLEVNTYVSTHGSLAGADGIDVRLHSSTKPFQLTAPLREPTAKIRIFKKHFIKRRMRFLAFQISLLLFSTISDLT